MIDFILVVMAILASLGVFVLQARRGRPIFGLIAGTATYLVVGRMILFLLTPYRTGPFTALYDGWFWWAVLLLVAALVVGMMGVRLLSALIAVIALIVVFGAPFDWHLSSSLGRDYKAECAAQHLALNSDGDGCEHDQTYPTTSPKTTAQCPAGFNVVYDGNRGNKVLSNGVQGTPTQVVNTVLSVAKHDTRVLQLYWNATPQGAAKPVSSWQDLESDGCYSSSGQAIYYQTLGAYQSAVKSSAPAPSTGVNTGVHRGGSPFQEAPGAIGGNRTATKVVFKNGSVVYIMHRCGNIVTAKPIPHVPTRPPTPQPPPRTNLPCYSPGNGPRPVGRPAPGQPICHGKDPSQGIDKVSGVPPQTTGCGADGGNTYPCKGGTATNHPTMESPPPASGTTQCGTSGNDPCPSPSPRPQPTYSPAPSGYPSPPPPNGGGGNYPSSSPSPPPASGDPGPGGG